MDEPDRFRSVADALALDLELAVGDSVMEEAAIQKAIDAYRALAGGGDPAELRVAEYLAEDDGHDRPPALERVRGASKVDIVRWRSLLADLAGY